MTELNTDAEGSTKVYAKTIAADIPLDANSKFVEALLSAFNELNRIQPDKKLILTGKRYKEATFSVWNYMDENKLTDAIEFLPYYNVCDSFPVKKIDCDLWIDRSELIENLSSQNLLERLSGKAGRQDYKQALFFTSFHPGKQEGNSRLMRIWLDHLKRAGYKIHVVYYMYDIDNVTDEIRKNARLEYDYYTEIPVESYQVGKNKNSLNVHLDDWCGVEALDAVELLTSKHEFDVAITNYSFMTAIFDRVAAYTRKILITHDNFSDRNRLMISHGYSESSWMSIDERGEALACSRADVVIALQDEEAAHFRRISSDASKICVISPLIGKRSIGHHEPGEKLKIGYFGSRNWLNERNIAEYMQLWLETPELATNSEILIAGGVCDHLNDFVSESLKTKVNPKIIGRVDDLADFFSDCDLIVNPERGGTGIKIKTLETMAYGMPFLTTHFGVLGIDTDSRFHHANNIPELVLLTREVVMDRALLTSLREVTKDLHASYEALNISRLDELLGSELTRDWEAPSPSDRLPKVSIVIPFYNVEAYIAECLLSVKTQDYPKIEVIAVNDCSTDGSAKVVKKFVSRDSRFELVCHEKNRGLGPARNTGVNYSTGDYLFFLDSDDMLSSPQAISKLVTEAKSKHCKVVIGSCQRLLPSGELADFDRGFDRLFSGRPGTIIDGDRAYLGASFIPGGEYVPMRAWGTLIDRDLYVKSRLEYPATEYEDLPHTPFLYYFAQQVLYISDITVTYRMRTDSISNTAWTVEAVNRYALLWAHIKDNIERLGLEQYMGDTAIKTAEHFLMKLRNNGLNADAEKAVIETLKEILSCARGELRESLFFQVMDGLRPFFDYESCNYENYQSLTSCMNAESKLKYYRDRISGSYVEHKTITLFK